MLGRYDKRPVTNRLKCAAIRIARVLAGHIVVGSAFAFVRARDSVSGAPIFLGKPSRQRPI